MAVKPIIDEIEKEVIDVTSTNFVHNDTSVVDDKISYSCGD